MQIVVVSVMIGYALHVNVIGMKESVTTMTKTNRLEIIYRCYYCNKEYDPNDVSELEEFNEEGEWENPCPSCKQPLKWGVK